MLVASSRPVSFVASHFISLSRPLPQIQYRSLTSWTRPLLDSKAEADDMKEQQQETIDLEGNSLGNNDSKPVRFTLEQELSLREYLKKKTLDPYKMSIIEWSQAAWDLGLQFDPAVCCRRITGVVTTALKASCICDDRACRDPSSPETGYVRCKKGTEWGEKESNRLHRHLANDADDSLDNKKEPEYLSLPEWNAIASKLKLGRSGMCCAGHVLHWRPKNSEKSLHINLDTRPWTEDDIAALRQAVNDLGSEWSAISLRLRRTVFECQRQWSRSQNRGAWKADEIQRWKEALQRYQPSEIALIAKHVGTRSKQQCYTRMQGIKTTAVKWKKQWDQALLNLVEKHGQDWTTVVDILNNEHGMNFCTNRAAAIRYQTLSRKCYIWTSEGERLLEQAVKKYGTKNWKAVAEYVTGDSDLSFSCKRHYENFLDRNYNRAPWTEQEIQLVDHIMNEIRTVKDTTGRQVVERINWKDIAAKMGTNRHPEFVRNRFKWTVDKKRTTMPKS